ncbi:PTGR1 [Mytilus coruscus]|uniref:Prostaglandin reductase 1 n=1 Tax=Mytilus coruscus TaxID=42192 RepID=A0A6J8AD67_MYTCO|nr:PTGR1 [Mytilus coruscus]
MFHGEPKEDDLELVEEDLPDLKEGEMLLEALYMSVDPYMRPFVVDRAKVGDTMIGEQIARVIESKNSQYSVGTIVRTHAGWRTHTVTSDLTGHMPDLGDLPLSTALGVVGMPAMAGYFGFLELCKPSEGETVLVNAASGAVGSVVGQIAKIKKCKVIGFAGTEEKCQWLRELGFDYAYNYKTVKLDEAIKEAAPEGIDCFFDNVGGEFTMTVLEHMRTFGRIAVCGTISGYNATEQPKGILPFLTILTKQLTVQGFIISSKWLNRYPEGEKQMVQWIKQGQMKYRETVTEGIENMYTAFQGLFKGTNIGKAIIKC